MACTQKETTTTVATPTQETLFSLVDPAVSGIQFTNTLTENEEVNYFAYQYLYMGGGVAIGDINNDGLQDIYFTANMESNKLYLNKGNLQFEDITAQAGVAGDERWDTGAAMADLNGDGWLDIYVSVSGKWASTKNIVYINNQDGTFTDQAAALGLADEGQSTQASFLDYDADGDLDVYVANYPATPFSTANFVYQKKHQHATHQHSDHLYRNDQGTFTDVTEAAGILNYGLSLSASVGDFDKNGYPDVYVSNDFASPDFFYFNNGDGTFSEKVKEVTKHTAFYGMGADVADFNNDQLLDIFQVDMTPEDNFRSKANMASMDIEGFFDMVDEGLHYQYMQNVLQVNQGIGADQLPQFGDVARMTGTALTDWSWSPLFVDLDNDGWKDLYITNGTRRDINNKDYFKKAPRNPFAQSKKADPLENLKKSLAIPSTKVDNYAYKNLGDLSYQKMTAEWGLSKLGFSNGSAYADLDNDGDQDLVVNNIDETATVFENKTSQITTNTYLSIRFQGPKWNQYGMDTKVSIAIDSTQQYAENYATRGFQSSSAPYVHFGTGTATTVDTVTITWFDQKVQVLANVPTNQQLTVRYEDAVAKAPSTTPQQPLFKALTPQETGVDYIHRENPYNDFKFEVLLPHKMSQFGPGIAVGTLDNTHPAFYVGGATYQAGSLYTWTADGNYQLLSTTVFETDKAQEDIDALFFDANGDGFQDLYVVSGGNEVAKDSPALQDRLYLNDQQGNLVKAPDALPEMLSSGSRVKAFDYDQDGDLDLFVGGRLVPKSYPLPASSYILRNDSKDGTVVFTDVTATVAPDLDAIGMVTDAAWTDINKDGQIDLVLVGEWMPVTVLINEQQRFSNQTAAYGLSNTVGWWNTVAADDIDADGDPDLIVGNLGLNYKYQATTDATFDVYAGDYDENGSLDIVLGYYFDGTQFPVRGRQCSSEQIPGIKKQYDNYDSFAAASLEEVYTDQKLANSLVHYQVQTFASTYFENLGNQQFNPAALPRAVQTSSMNKIIVADYDQDGHKDLLVAGNLMVSEVETTRNDASFGQYLRGDGTGHFTPVPYTQSGFMAPKDVKDMELLTTPTATHVIIANNNAEVTILQCPTP